MKDEENQSELRGKTCPLSAVSSSSVAVSHPSSFTFHPSEVALILLAAGAARRMKNHQKQLLEFHGETLLRRSVKTAIDSICRPIYVVLGANAERLKAEIADLQVELVINENWASGMASSLKTGLEKLLEIEPQISAVCVMLADQPLINASIINQLAEIFKRGENQVAACQYEETIGVPAIFSRALFDELKNLSGDAGAKKIIEKYIEPAGKLFVPQAALDIDSKQDYERLLKLEETAI